MHTTIIWQSLCLSAAPEVTAASEMFSFGLLLFELLTAEMPHFHVPSELELIEDEEEREKAWEEVEEKYHKSWGEQNVFLFSFQLQLASNTPVFNGILYIFLYLRTALVIIFCIMCHAMALSLSFMIRYSSKTAGLQLRRRLSTGN